MRVLFEVIDPEHGQLRCVECGAVDHVTHDGETIMCTSCYAVDDLAAVPIDVEYDPVNDMIDYADND